MQIHGLSLLPITLPVSAISLLAAPIAVPYRRRYGRMFLENQLKKEITEVIKELSMLEKYTEQQNLKHSFIPILDQNSLEPSTTMKDLFLRTNSFDFNSLHSLVKFINKGAKLSKTIRKT